MPTPEPTPRPRIVGPLLVALVFLAVIGASIGFVLGTQGGDDEPDTNTGTGQNTGQDIGEPLTPSPSPSPSPASATCPTSTQQRAGEDLTLLLYVRTERSEVWICSDDEDNLYYQGHSGQPGEKLIDGVNAIFLTEVETTVYGYRAFNSSGASVTEYMVSSKELVIRPPNGTPITEPAVHS